MSTRQSPFLWKRRAQIVIRRKDLILDKDCPKKAFPKKFTIEFIVDLNAQALKPWLKQEGLDIKKLRG